eukprot:CAMPEP_0174880084 /NCGR_PEP_ID=MMETSP1114-20130205/83583_1 /TAXON_ID=312471 /ORGANISM="Neobodo designis, Strain CCAP 1951/1" /LENGTH=1112 /DNA_ID=CAMNT_0016115479 /DNA_START=51 /DNA_END=3389 /DNA_ORIENTATION=-
MSPRSVAATALCLLVAALVGGAVAQSDPSLPDSFYFAVRIPAGQAVPTAAAVEYSLRTLVGGMMPQVFLRTPTRATATWQYEFVFVGPDAELMMRAYIAAGQTQEAAWLNATHVSALAPPDEFFFMVRLQAGKTVPTEAALSRALAPLTPNEPAPEVYLRTPSQATGTWSYEFAFIGPDAGDKMAIFVAIGKTGEKAILNATDVTSLVPGDEFFFTVHLWANSTTPSDLALQKALHTLLPSKPAPEVFIRRMSKQNTAQWQYEFAFVGSANGAAFMNALVSTPQAQLQRLLNATMVQALVPGDEFFFAVKLGPGAFTPTDVAIATALNPLVRWLPAPELYVRYGSSQATGTWSYEFAFVGPNAAEYMAAFINAGQGSEAILLNATYVTGLVPADTFFFAVRMPWRAPTPDATQVANQLSAAFATSASPSLPMPEIYMRPADRFSPINRTYDFAFVGEFAGQYMSRFIAAGRAAEQTALQAAAVFALVPSDQFFFAVRLDPTATVPNATVVQSLLAPLGANSTMHPPEIFWRLPSQGSAQWQYEFAFVGPYAQEYFQLFMARGQLGEAGMLHAVMVTGLVPDDSFFFAVRLGFGGKSPSNLQVSQWLAALRPDLDPPEIYTRPPSVINARYAYEFAFVGPGGSQFMAAFLGAGEVRMAAILHARFVGPLVPPDMFFSVVKQVDNRPVPSPRAVEVALAFLRPDLYSEVYIRPATRANAGYDYEFAFVGPDAPQFLTALSNVPTAALLNPLNASFVGPLVPPDTFFFGVRIPAGDKVPTDMQLSNEFRHVDKGLPLPAVYIRLPSDNSVPWQYEFAFIGPNAAVWLGKMVALPPWAQALLLNASYVGALVPPDEFFFQVRLRLGQKIPYKRQVVWSLQHALEMPVEVYYRAPSVPNAHWKYEFAFVGPWAQHAFQTFAGLTPKNESRILNASFVGPVVPPIGYFGVVLRDGATIPTPSVLNAALESLVDGPLTALPEAYIRTVPGGGYSYEFACVGPDADYCTTIMANANSADELRVLNATRVEPIAPGPRPAPPGPAPPAGDSHTGTTIAIAIIVVVIVGIAVAAVVYVFRQRSARRHAHVALVDPSHIQSDASDASSVRASMNEYGYGSANP